LGNALVWFIFCYSSKISSFLDRIFVEMMSYQSTTASWLLLAYQINKEFILIEFSWKWWEYFRIFWVDASSQRPSFSIEILKDNRRSIYHFVTIIMYRQSEENRTNVFFPLSNPLINHIRRKSGSFSISWKANISRIVFFFGMSSQKYRFVP